MALRVFTDRDGFEWQVWNVDPASGHRGVRIDLREGWLCFERVGGGERCRIALSDVPPAWEQLPVEGLDRLRRVAAAKRSSRTMTRDSGEHRQMADEESARRRTSGPRQVLGTDDED